MYVCIYVYVFLMIGSTPLHPFLLFFTNYCILFSIFPVAKYCFILNNKEEEGGEIKLKKNRQKMVQDVPKRRIKKKNYFSVLCSFKCALF